MKLLILGGTRFLGRHCVEAALARGHDVTIFTRGVQPVPWAGRVTHLVGNRDPRIEPGLAALESGEKDAESGEWDAAIDMSGYVPRCVKASVAALDGRVGHYTFVSSISVYANASLPGRDESTPVVTLDDPQSEDIPAHYGALKARCEDEVRAVFGRRALVVRPGLIVGPHDPTDRFAYWVARFVCPEVLGARPEAAVVPAPPERAVQFIDARDLAAWSLDMIEQRADGTFDACSPAGLWTMGALVEALVAAARAAGSSVVPRVDRRRNAAPARGHAVDRTAVVASRERPGVGGIHGVELRARGRARPQPAAARRDGRGHRGLAAHAGSFGRVAQCPAGRQGTRDSGRCRCRSPSP